MGVSEKFQTENNEGNGERLPLPEIGVGIFVAAACTYFAATHLIPQTEAYIAAKAAEDTLRVLSRVGFGSMGALAGTGAAWAAGRLRRR